MQELESLRSALTEAAEGARLELIDLLRELVRRPSVNPPGDTRDAAGVLAEKISGDGIETEIIEQEGAAASVVASYGEQGGPQLVFNSHIDTVGAGELDQWEMDPFTGIVKDGKIYGRGAADAKGPTAAMAMALLLLKRLQVPLAGSLCLTAVADEESGARRGTIPLLEDNIIVPKWAVIGEITGNQVAIAEKGIMQINITTFGKTAHASHPWEGVNAVSKMVKLLAALETELQPKLEKRKHQYTPRASMNIGLIKGGIRANVVPDRCEAVVDRRLLPTENFDQAVAEINEIIQRIGRADPEIKVKVEVPRFGPPYHTPESEMLVQEGLATCKQLGLSGSAIGYKQSSDGTFFARRGIPTILFGPGIPELAHAPNEYIEVDDLIPAVVWYALLAARLLGRRG